MFLMPTLPSAASFSLHFLGLTSEEPQLSSTPQLVRLGEWGKSTSLPQPTMKTEG